jgi:gas vesicle protein
MSCNCPDCQNQSCSSSSFLTGVIIGSIIGAVIAVIIYRQSRTKVFRQLQGKIETFIKNQSRSPSPKVKPKRHPRVFLKPRR